MDRTERFYRIERLLREHRLVPLEWFLRELEISRATFKRDLEYLRERMNVPIEFDREASGYRFGEVAGGKAAFSLPGVWFNAEECQALLSLWRLVHELEPRLLGPQAEPLLARLKLLLGRNAPVDEVLSRIRLLPQARRRHRLDTFERCAAALLARRRLWLRYYVRARDEMTEREVSPQRLVYYRDNWYLDAWCHKVRGLRSFSLDAVRMVRQLEGAAREVPAKRLDAELGAGYGIFAGPARHRAKLRFTPERARWVEREEWHPAQQGRYDKDSSYILEVPYADDRELVMDILKFGPDVTVLAPPALRDKVRALHRASLL
ncbi:MAG TPA: WYL domain-containing protein [Gammaproteobacteria bacterium]|nr:WYL domain-containing protein [Gammaproteobacteria bacterium]